MSLQDAKLILTPNGYKARKVYAVKPTDGSGDATVTRNTTKTRVNSSGLIESNAVNVLAPDYLNGVCPALNVEGQATNLNGYSSDYTNWGNNNLTTIVSTTETSLDSNKPATLIEATSTGSSLNRIENIPTTATTYINSVFFKQGTAPDFRFDTRFFGGTPSINNAFLYNFSTGNITTLASVPGSLVDVYVKDYVNGWKEFVVINTNNSSGNNTLQSYVYPDFTNGTGTSLVWNNNMVEGNNLYLPIYTSANTRVTRSADTVTVPIPAGTTEIIEKYEDGTTNTITTIPASPYTVPTGKRYEYILMR